MSQPISIEDIHAIYFMNLEEVNGLTQESPILLNCIADDYLDGYDEEAIDSLRKVIVDIISQSSTPRKLQKPDPIAALLSNLDRDFDNGDKPITYQEYESLERSRVMEKWRSNRIGEINEMIATLLPNISKSSAGQLDLIVTGSTGKPTALVEVKNKFNTMNASAMARLRTEMDRLVLNRGGTYLGCEAILAERIPKTDGSEQPFSPSNNATGEKFQTHPQIKRMGLNQLLSRYDRLVYLKSMIFIARVMSEQNALPSDYNMQGIFQLLKESLS